MQLERLGLELKNVSIAFQASPHRRFLTCSGHMPFVTEDVITNPKNCVILLLVSCDLPVEVSFWFSLAAKEAIALLTMSEGKS